MKVQHRWLHTVTMRCDLGITITGRGNALEHDDRSALSWPRVFLNIMCLQMSLCFMNHNLWPYFILWEPKKKRLLGTAVFIAHVLTAEITTCITSLLSTCRHLAGKQPDECKGCNSVFVLAKKLQPIYLTKYRIFGITSIRPHFKCI